MQTYAGSGKPFPAVFPLFIALFPCIVLPVTAQHETYLYPSYFKLQVRWLRDSAHQWASPFG
ncbi:hypothetical protein, partial [Dickeya sp. ws52]|uniref:hypothetical protein n=1 Tax=Dickeya sp. ws52 TaxID=2576377 RepID=UPI001F2C07BF